MRLLNKLFNEDGCVSVETSRRGFSGLREPGKLGSSIQGLILSLFICKIEINPTCKDSLDQTEPS